MVPPIPQNVKDVLGKLTVQDQVTMRAYIASLRESIKEAEHDALAAADPDAHAHYHGHEKCTSDHGHSHAHHGDEEKDGRAEMDEGAVAHDHGHKHGHDHSSENEGEPEKKKMEHDHGHSHDHPMEEATAEDDDMPAWKKKALASGSAANDPMAAPFGGTWNAESSVDATKSDSK